ncbi:hypothetical protein A8C75_07650 [Marinobacterium aestuarii]|uniref:DUF5610 domain-containing protein n=1 Tax=Marinobacterium aestuarii TaxID=1821621 RepID=A0A1A9EWX0_9GAMM|nr:DUF5610 domain-containing protein [Marinobacterium aestuarii]ANG62375.1 hypothetical protein A8C75_07650 [Marinobacterium aestuarii]
MDIKPDNFGRQVSARARAQDRPAGGLGTAVSQAARSDKQLTPADHSQARNEAILEASLKVSITVGSQPMEALYRSVIGALNEALQTDLGDSAIQTAYAAELDVSPEATAARILSRSTAFFASYQSQHPELNAGDARLSFADLIQGGIDQGFAQARDILKGQAVLEGNIASAIDATYSLVVQGLEAFRAQPETPVETPAG